MIEVKPYISEMPIYSPPWSRLDRTKYLRFDLNENSDAPAENVIAALKRYIDERRIQMYPEYVDFLPKLAEYAGVGEENLILTNGSDNAIDIILRAFLGPGDVMAIAQPGFPIFEQVAGVIGAETRGVPYKEDLSFPYDDFVRAAAGASLIVLINPDNPTGSAISLSRIQHILEENPDAPVLVDEAYFEYTGVTALEFLETHANLIITRTFSKAFAMAGLRLGYAIAHPDIITQFHKIRGPFDVNVCAIVAAEAQIDQPGPWKKHVDEVMNISKPFLEDFLKEHDVRLFPGAAHFLLIKPGDRDNAVRYLKENGILVRPMTAPLIRDSFRMNIDTLDRTKRFIEVYKKFLTEFDNEPG
ncbi:MAG: aminotransferase class I/II-fold pyridoxal phosphate-dependent enzyme [Desulfobacterales bacterium]|nr:aminotransferase class I/II-fold pyridoxal phosphate-dependent enzyme [Desulfobacterales bacterium]